MDLRRDHLRPVRTICVGTLVGLFGISVGVGMIVWFALDGQPLAGNLVTWGGVSAVTWGLGLLALIAIPLALFAGRNETRAGVQAMASGHPELVEANLDEERLTEAFAAGVFVEYAVAGGAAFLSAITYHITSDPILLALVGGLELFLIARFPTRRRLESWLPNAKAELAKLRNPKSR